MRIFIACADERLRIAMFLLLNSEVDATVVGISDRLQGLITQVEASQADVLVLEWALAISDLKKLIDNARHLACQPKVIYLANQSEDMKQIEATGVDAFMVKNTPPDKLLAIIHDIRLGETNSSQEII